MSSRAGESRPDQLVAAPGVPATPAVDPSVQGEAAAVAAEPTPALPRSSGRRLGDRIFATITAGSGAFIVVVMACWTIWAGLDQVNGTGVNADGGANEVVDSQHVKVSFTVSADAGASVACAVEAQNVEFAITGWKVVQLPTSSKTTRSFTETVRTTEPSVAGSLDSCWLSGTR